MGERGCCDGRFDEWYFFRSLEELLKLDAFCNYGGSSLEDARALAFQGGLDLNAHLERYRPEIVIGYGKYLFVISPRDEIVELMRAFDDA